MAIGDDAQAEGMPLVPVNGAVGSAGKVRQGPQEFNRTRDYIANFYNLAKDYADTLFASISLSWASITGKPSTFPPSSHSHTALIDGAATLSWNGSDRWNSTGGFGAAGIIATAGDVYVPNSTAASASWTAAYINGDGRLCRGASSLRYKEHVEEAPASAFGNIFKPLNRFQMRDGDGRWTFGHIAEELAADPATEPFVMYDGEGRPDSIDYVPLLLAKVEVLQASLTALQARLTALEAAQ